MINYIWAGLMLISIVAAISTGRVEALTNAAFASATDAITLIIGLLGIMCFWTGIMKIAERSGFVLVLGKIISPITRLLFPDINKNSKAMGAITMNMVANMLGLSNAATPLGLAAIKELSKLNRESNKASNAMCMFVIVNTASIQIIPTTLIALRTQAGSANPFAIIVPIWIVSISVLLVGVIFAKILEKRS